MPEDTTKVHYAVPSPSDTGLTRDEREDCVKHVTEEWDSWNQHWASKMGDFEKYYDQWMGKPPTRDQEWQAQHHKKLTWLAEKTLVARFHSALFPTSAPIDYDATEVQDEFTGIIAKSIVAHWFKIGKFSKEFLSGMRPAAIYGTGLFEDDWFQKIGTKIERVEEQIPDFRRMVDQTGLPVLDEEGNVRAEQIGMRPVTREKERRKILEDRYRVQKANIFAWRVHPHKLSDDDDYPVIKQEFITFDDLLKKEKEAEKYDIDKFQNMDKIKEDRFKPKEEDVRRLAKGGDYIDDKNPRIELLHYWGFYGEGDAEKKPMWICVVNRKYKLIFKDNPFWHKKPSMFHIIWTEDVKDSYYGIGLAQIGEDAEDRANKSVNIREDILRKQARSSGWYNAMDKKIKKTLIQKNTPGLWRACTDVNNAAKPDVVVGLRPEDYKEEDTAVSDHREITGATTSMLPTADVREQHKTLGGMQQMLGQAVQRLKPDLVMMEMMGIRQIANRGFLLTMQFFSQPKAIELVASQDQLKKLGLQKIYRLRPEDITQKVNFFCTGLSESVEKSQNIEKLMKFTEVTAKVQPLQEVVNYKNIAKKIALWLGFEDVEDFIQMNPFAPFQPAPQAPQVAPGGVPGGVQGPGQGRGRLGGGMPGMGGGSPGGGLPPQAIQAIAQRMRGGAGAPPMR